MPDSDFLCSIYLSKVKFNDSMIFLFTFEKVMDALKITHKLQETQKALACFTKPTLHSVKLLLSFRLEESAVCVQHAFACILLLRGKMLVWISLIETWDCSPVVVQGTAMNEFPLQLVCLHSTTTEAALKRKGSTLWHVSCLGFQLKSPLNHIVFDMMFY